MLFWLVANYPFNLLCEESIIHSLEITNKDNIDRIPVSRPCIISTITCCRFHLYPFHLYPLFYYCAVLWCAQIIEYIMARLSHSFVFTSHYHHYTDASESIELLKYLPDTFECAFKITSFFSIIFHAIYGGNMRILSYYPHLIECMIYISLFKFRLWNNGMRCVSFFILMQIYKEYDFVFVSSSSMSPVKTERWLFLTIHDSVAFPGLLPINIENPHQLSKRSATPWQASF